MSLWRNFWTTFDSSTFFDVRIHLFNGYLISRLFLHPTFFIFDENKVDNILCETQRMIMMDDGNSYKTSCSYICACMPLWSIITLNIALRIHSKFFKMLYYNILLLILIKFYAKKYFQILTLYSEEKIYATCLDYLTLFSPYN